MYFFVTGKFYFIIKDLFIGKVHPAECITSSGVVAKDEIAHIWNLKHVMHMINLIPCGLFWEKSHLEVGHYENGL